MSHPPGWLLIKTTDDASTGEDMEKWEPSRTAGGNGEQHGRLLRQLKIGSPCDSTLSLSVHTQEK